ncbi:MAG TPA: cysteine dioxygenase family protein [Thermoleophilia bacterium]|nr:cysteine dioxygenase family protein [Thermoleophilia bacterium]
MSAAPDDRLTLDRFIVEMGKQPVDELTHDRLQQLVNRLDLSADLIETRACFAPDAYTRNLVCRTPTFELLVLCWRPGHESTIHDHAGSLNAIAVHRGALTSRIFVPADGAGPGSGPVALDHSDTFVAGGWTGVDRHGIHQLANTGTDELVTVHIYAAPLTTLNVYSLESPEVVVRPLRYTLEEDLA